MASVSGGAERRGLHLDRLGAAFTLAANTTLTPPCVTAQVRLDRFGALTIRDEGRLTGQVRPTGAPGTTPVAFTLGPHPHLTSARAADVMPQEKNSEDDVTATVYRATLKNGKAAPCTPRWARGAYAEADLKQLVRAAGRRTCPAPLKAPG